ncbi:hypothetical protein GBA65_04090 [Rubrobacter marinus]|uniref:Uncharacterized protein n=1 Tax=Rubrobacter marinus TaxID=2653852 RepID=A0A6G8PUX2_9ACTN|nr:hypothetical protein [Rubrobacter marinus]QIN77835.1 hypothetical protein GBA65_04090 [Rubrobacter marinus]
MPRTPKREKRRANLNCNNCGHQFVAPAWHAEIVLSDVPGPVGWVPEADTGATSPNCGSRAVGVR